jgi:hypothetical protein
MKIISFDVGIKNMAYCILSVSGSQSIHIDDWNILNLINDTPTDVPPCSCVMPAKNKKSLPKTCGKKAKYHKNGEHFCDKHAKAATQYLLPTKQRTTAYLKKLRIDELITIGNSFFLFTDIENLAKQKKQILIDIVDKFYRDRCMDLIVNKKGKTANETDLIHIGKSMKAMLNRVAGIDEITHVVIENQISPIANRMKTIQGMLAQYFIMKNDDAIVEFVSSANKLKQFNGIVSPIVRPESTANEGRTNPNYKEHKKDSVFYCSEIIKANATLEAWSESLNTKKKDDLADCFLQGIWYLKHHNIILYAEDLKINIVALS